MLFKGWMDGKHKWGGKFCSQYGTFISILLLLLLLLYFLFQQQKQQKNSSLLLLLLLLLAAAAMMYSVIQHKTCADHTPVLMCLLGNNSRFLLCLLLLPDRILHCEGFLVSFFIIPSAAGSFCCCQVKLFE